MTSEEMLVIQNMGTYGGGFVQALSECFLRADQVNFMKLKNAFPEYWLEYSTKFNNNESQSGGDKDYV